MDITLKGIPDEISEKQLQEWVAVLVQRYYNAKLTPPEEMVKQAKTNIDTYRTANAMTALFKAEEKIAVEPTPVEVSPEEQVTDSVNPINNTEIAK